MHVCTACEAVPRGLDIGLNSLAALGATGTPNWLSWLGARLLNLRSGVRFPLKGRTCAMAPS